MDSSQILETITSWNDKMTTLWSMDVEFIIEELVGLLDEFSDELKNMFKNNPTDFCNEHRDIIIQIYDRLCMIKGEETVSFGDLKTRITNIINSDAFKIFFEAISEVRNSLKDNCNEEKNDFDCNF